MPPLFGIDLGGTKIEGVVLQDPQATHILKRMRLPTEQEKGYPHIIRQIYTLVETMAAETRESPKMIGIGTPGILDPGTQLLKNSNTQCLNGKPLKTDLENVLGLPVAMANDANCFALAEARLGAARDIHPAPAVVWGTIMGTGVGSGIIVNGKILTGRHGIGGEWGHNFLDESGGDCYCGKAGCVETVISGPALTRYYNDLTGRNLALPQIVDNYYDGDDEVANATMKRLVHFFGKAAASVINVIDPDVVILGGGLGNIELLYTEGVEEVKKHVFNDKLETVFLSPKLGDSAGVFGAALLTDNG